MFLPALVACAAALLLPRSRRKAVRLLRVTRVVQDLQRAETFYRDALGFQTVGHGPASPAVLGLLGLSGPTAKQAVLRLGNEEIALLQLDPPGPPYPADSRSDDLWFQHLAIVVNDMAAAHARLMHHHPGTISTNGPETLPPANGCVTAFKFRDPDGHPLELIGFPPGEGRALWRHRDGGPCLGIDHSGIAASSTARSLRFYRSLGLRVAAQSSNHGPAQSRLDGVPGARVCVTGLRPRAGDGPGLELLAYDPPGRPGVQVPGAIAADWVTLETTALRRGVARVARDPDGHLLLLVGSRITARPPRRVRR